MPLIKGKSPKSVSQNIRTEIQAVYRDTALVPKPVFRCKHCGVEHTEQNRNHQCMARGSTWMQLWPRHEWV
jgi:hypothetical protein